MLSAAASANRLADRFTLRDRLGEGGQGEVWRARDDQLGIDVALKLIRRDPAQTAAAFAALERESSIASSLDHPFILTIYPPQRDGDLLLLPMEYAPGGDLRRLRGATYLEIVPPLIEIAQALEHAHERGVIHRDLKPGNVLLDARGRVRVGDFGAASRIAGAGNGGPSPFTASPEQLRGEPPSPGDDIYGLGALAYELLSGYPPHYPRFDRDRVLDEPVPELKPLQQAPPQLIALVTRMLSKRAQARPRTMRAVIDELDATLNDTLTFEYEPASEPARRAVPAHPSARPAATRPKIVDPVAASQPWGDLSIEALPGPRRLETERGPLRWPWYLAAAAVAAAAFIWLPNLAQRSDEPAPVAAAPATPPPAEEQTPAASPAPAPEDTETQEEAIARVRDVRTKFETRLADLEKRGAGIWGGPEFASAKLRAAEAVGAFDAGDPYLAEDRLGQASKLLDTVAGRAQPAFAEYLAAGDKALAAEQLASARQAFENARRIDADDRRMAEGLRRVTALERVLPLLASAENAERSRNFDRAERDFTAALALDSGNARARSGLQRVRASSGNDAYSRDVGQGFAALGAGRLDEARTAFERARIVRPQGQEANDGLARVNDAGRTRGYASLRARATKLESEERWSEAVREYESALASDPTLEFARTGRSRAQARADLASRMQDLLDRPDRLAAPAVRVDAANLLERARSQSPSGPVLRSQISRLELLLPNFDRPVRLALESDNATQVAIQRVGSFGTFARREIELKPGKYTVVGTRSGFRDVRREVTVAPGQEVQTIAVRCIEPI
jgi:eukaryotic-like serine/threonine-protein kinase